MSADEDITPARAAELVREGDAQLIDVRTPEEVEAGRIEGSLHIELEQLPAQAAEIERERPIVFYCRTGARSAMATGAFRAAGYEAYNLDGGLLAWVEGGQPIEPEDGSVARH
jgi:rhodanese-related sulfurtransferase